MSLHTYLMIDTIKIPFSPMVTSFFLLFDFSRLRLVHNLKRERKKEKKKNQFFHLSILVTYLYTIGHTIHPISFDILLLNDQQMSTMKIIKPIAKYPNVNGTIPIPITIKPLAVAGTTLKEGSVVYLLHQLPYNFLLTDFYDHNQHYNKIPVGKNQISS
jgi:hypothetical protein